MEFKVKTAIPNSYYKGTIESTKATGNNTENNCYQKEKQQQKKWHHPPFHDSEPFWLLTMIEEWTQIGKLSSQNFHMKWRRIKSEKHKNEVTPINIALLLAEEIDYLRNR